MLQPENQAKKYQHLFTGIETGKIRIPQFQREFVWTKQQTAKLIDSIIKGFPIGTFIFWETNDTMRTVRSIGNAELPELRVGETSQFVLDGQQRITSLYAVQKGLIFKQDKKEISYKDICINLDVDPEADPDDEIVLDEVEDGMTSLSVFDLLNGRVMELAQRYSDPIHQDRIDTYRNRLTGYDFSTILMPGYPIDVACEVFTRINTGGTQLSLFEIMAAKTYDLERKFDLAQEYEWLLDSEGEAKDLEDANFDTIPSSTVLQCIAAHLRQAIKRQDILKLEKIQVIEGWQTVKDGIFSTVDYLRSHMRIPVSHLLPYNTLLVPLCYFFIRNEGKMPNVHQDKWLQQYFFWASLTNRFTSGSEGKVALDLGKMDQILQERAPDYQGEEVRLTIEDIQWRWFSTGEAFCKAILCLFAYFQPKSFHNNSMVNINNSWLKQANSRNYHHFFPKSYLNKLGYQDWQANTIVNITIVDDYLNKRKIRARSPKDYMDDFDLNNPDLSLTMKTHLIDDLSEFGIWDEDYEQFIEKRSERIFEELNHRLNPDLN